MIPVKEISAEALVNLLLALALLGMMHPTIRIISALIKNSSLGYVTRTKGHNAGERAAHPMLHMNHDTIYHILHEAHHILTRTNFAIVTGNPKLKLAKRGGSSILPSSLSTLAHHLG
jgi:hypothetical protein